MAISSLKPGYSGPQLTRTVDKSTTDTGVTTRTAVISGDKRSREATLTVSPNAEQASVVRTATLAGPKVNREVSVTRDGQGNAARSVNVTLANDKVINRERTRSVKDDGSVVITGNVNGLRSVRTYVADADATGISGEITVTRGDSTRTTSFDWAKKPDPRPMPPTPVSSGDPSADLVPAKKLEIRPMPPTPVSSGDSSADINPISTVPVYETV